MKKLTILFIFFLIPWLLPAPGNALCYIERAEPINYYGRLVEAVYAVESSRNPLAYNSKENAVGGFQIRQCKLDQYIKETGKFYTLEQMYDKKIAESIFMHFTKGRNYERVARSWNGSGSATTAYWKLVKAKL